MSSALKLVEAWLSQGWKDKSHLDDVVMHGGNDRQADVSVADLRAVVALAKRAGDPKRETRLESAWRASLLREDALRSEIHALKRRVRLARPTFYAAKLVAKYGTTNVGKLTKLKDLLDLRKPLPRAKATSSRRR